MEDRLLFDQFHEAFDVEPRPGSFERLRSTLVKVSPKPRQRAWWRPSRMLKSPGMLAFVAAVIALAVIITLVFAGQALRFTHKVQVHPPPSHRTAVPASATVIHSVSINPTSTAGVFVRQPIPMEQPIDSPCAVEAQRWGCMGSSVVKFSGPMTGWTTVGSAASEGPTDLYRTDDAGAHWRAVSGWDYSGGREIVSGLRGAELLIITDWGWQGPALFHSIDGGATWTSEGFPLTQAQAAAVGGTPVTNCKSAHFLCSQDPAYFPSGEIYFADPHDGWVLTQEPSYSVADLFHTTDSGAHWALSSRIDIKTQFGLDLGAGIPVTLQTPLPPGKGGGVLPPNHLLTGQLLFQDASHGWFVYLPFIYRTTDGGRSWIQEQLPAIPGVSATDIFLKNFRFFDQQNGVIELYASEPGISPTLLSRTADGGANWSAPAETQAGGSMVSGVIDFIDAQTWFAINRTGQLVRTLDAGGHWDQLPADGLPRGTFGGPGTLDFLDRLHGWYYAGSFYATTDGGLHWSQVTLPRSD